MRRLQPRHGVWVLVAALALTFVLLGSGLAFD